MHSAVIIEFVFKTGHSASCSSGMGKQRGTVDDQRLPDKHVTEAGPSRLKDICLKCLSNLTIEADRRRNCLSRTCIRHCIRSRMYLRTCSRCRRPVRFRSLLVSGRLSLKMSHFEAKLATLLSQTPRFLSHWATSSNASTSTLKLFLFDSLLNRTFSVSTLTLLVEQLTALFPASS